jgi:hypothetical protein
MSLFFQEAQDGGVEVKRGVLVFNHYTGEADLHGVLIGDLAWRVEIDGQRTPASRGNAIVCGTAVKR